MKFRYCYILLSLVSWIPHNCLNIWWFLNQINLRNELITRLNHRVIILNRGSMFTFHWREFSLWLSSAHSSSSATTPPELHRQKIDRRRCNSRWIPPQPPPLGALTKGGAVSSDVTLWRHAVTLHILVGKICISFFLFYCEGRLSLVVLWLCGTNTIIPYLVQRSDNLELGDIVTKNIFFFICSVL